MATCCTLLITQPSLAHILAPLEIHQHERLAKTCRLWFRYRLALNWNSKVKLLKDRRIRLTQQLLPCLAPVCNGRLPKDTKAVIQTFGDSDAYLTLMIIICTSFCVLGIVLFLLYRKSYNLQRTQILLLPLVCRKQRGKELKSPVPSGQRHPGQVVMHAIRQLVGQALESKTVKNTSPQPPLQLLPPRSGLSSRFSFVSG